MATNVTKPWILASNLLEPGDYWPNYSFIADVVPAFSKVGETLTSPAAHASNQLDLTLPIGWISAFMARRRAEIRLSRMPYRMSCPASLALIPDVNSALFKRSYLDENWQTAGRFAANACGAFAASGLPARRFAAPVLRARARAVPSSTDREPNNAIAQRLELTESRRAIGGHWSLVPKPAPTTTSR